jgi:hypothetical protein
VEAIAGFAPEPMAQLAAALGVDPGGLAPRITQLAGGGSSLRDLRVERDALEPVAQAASARPELRRLDPPPGRQQLLRLLERAW